MNNAKGASPLKKKKKKKRLDMDTLDVIKWYHSMLSLGNINMTHFNLVNK